MMDQKIFNKKVGTVEIFECYGSLTDQRASATSAAILRKLDINKSRAALFNLKGIRQLDDEGFDSLVESVRCLHKCALLGSPAILSRWQDPVPEGRTFKIVEDEAEATHFFARELAALGKGENQFPGERRRFERLLTTLPLRFGCRLENGKKISLFGVVTNLGEGGLYAEFIDSESERRGREWLLPDDLRLLHLDLVLSCRETLNLKGRVVHKNPLGGGVGIEFMDMEDGERKQILDCLFQMRLQES